MAEEGALPGAVGDSFHVVVEGRGEVADLQEVAVDEVLEGIEAVVEALECVADVLFLGFEVDGVVGAEDTDAATDGVGGDPGGGVIRADHGIGARAPVEHAEGVAGELVGEELVEEFAAEIDVIAEAFVVLARLSEEVIDEEADGSDHGAEGRDEGSDDGEASREIPEIERVAVGEGVPQQPGSENRQDGDGDKGDQEDRGRGSRAASGRLEHAGERGQS